MRGQPLMDTTAWRRITLCEVEGCHPCDDPPGHLGWRYGVRRQAELRREAANDQCREEGNRMAADNMHPAVGTGAKGIRDV